MNDFTNNQVSSNYRKFFHISQKNLISLSVFVVFETDVPYLIANLYDC